MLSESKTCLWSPLWHRYAKNVPGVLQPQFCLWIEESHAVHFIAMWVCTSLWSLKLQSSYRLFLRVCRSWLQDEFVVECFLSSSIGNMHSWELWTRQALGRNHLFHLTKLCRTHSKKFNWWVHPLRAFNTKICQPHRLWSPSLLPFVSLS
jgi:hypothetical protein